MSPDSFPKSLFRELVGNKRFVHLVSTNASEITNGFLDFIWDIGVSGARGSEDKLFSANRHLLDLFRRGLSLGVKVSRDCGNSEKPLKWFEYDLDKIDIWILKRGMKKFEDLPFNHSYRLRQIASSVGTDLQGLKLLASEKLDGENSQISYLDVTDQWVIGSKNVTILCSHLKDLDKAFYSESRYESAKANAYSWFQILEEFRTCSTGDYETQLSELKRTLGGNTLLCELVGNLSRQHVISYSVDRPQLYFFGLVSKESQHETCCSPLSLLRLLDPFFFKYVAQFVNLPSQSDALGYLEKGEFEKYSFGWSPISSLEDCSLSFRSAHELDVYLAALQSIVYLLRTNTEGVVLYLIKSGQHSDQDVVLSVHKMKTLRFSNLRLIRENLTNLVIKNFELSRSSWHKQALRKEPCTRQSQVSEFSVSEFWVSVYKYLVILIQNSADNFYDKISNHFKVVQRQISSVHNNLFGGTTASQIESEFVFLKQLLLSLSICLLSKVIHLSQTAKKVDPVQLSRCFFNSYSSFISDMEFQVSNSREITGIPANKYLDEETHIPGAVPTSPPTSLDLGSVPSGSTIEILTPPFSWSWDEIKDLLSQDFPLDRGVWVPSEDGIYLTEEPKNSEHSAPASTCSKPDHHVFVSIRHTLDDALMQGKSLFYSHYKIYAPGTDTPSLLKTPNSQKMSRFPNNSCIQLKAVADRLVRRVHDKLPDEVGSTVQFDKLSSNHQLVVKLEILQKMLPWVDSRNGETLFPSGYAVNIRDFERCMYVIFGLDSFSLAMDTLYGGLDCRPDLAGRRDDRLAGGGPVGPGFRLESTFLLPCGVPGSGKTFLFKSFLRKLLDCSGGDSCYYFSALTSGERAARFDMEDELVYSLVVPSTEDSADSDQFDLILYVSRDGCAQGVANGFKYNYETLEAASGGGDDALSPGQPWPDHHPHNGLPEDGFQKLSKKSKACMDFIIDYFVKKCTELVEEGQAGSEHGETGNSPRWLERLKGRYRGNRNLRLMVLVDVNHTPERLIQLSEDFRDQFKLGESALYRAILVFLDSLGSHLGRRGGGSWRFTFSKEHVILSMLRMTRRTCHSTLKGLCRKNISILLHFLALYSQRIKVIPREGGRRIINSRLSKSVLRSLGYRGVILLKNRDSEFMSRLSGESRSLSSSLLSDLPRVANGVDVCDPTRNDELSDQFLEGLERLSELVGEAPEPLDHEEIDSFHSNLMFLCARVVSFRSFADDLKTSLHYELGGRFRVRSSDLEILPKEELGEYLSEVHSRYNLTAVTFGSHKSSIEAIGSIWSDHKDSLFRLAGVDSVEARKHEEMRSSTVKHVTCCFFGHKSGSTGGTGKTLDFGSLLDGQMISSMEILFSMPYIGRSYDFQVSFLVYIHDWRLAFLTVSSRSSLFEIPSNEDHYDILIDRKGVVPPRRSGCKRLKAPSAASHSTDRLGALGKEPNVLLAPLLPFRENGHSHITLFSGKFKPVISNVAIDLLGEDFFREWRDFDVDESGVISLEVRVNEQPLQGVLNDGLSEEESSLDPVRTIRVLAVRLWEEEIVLTGSLGYM